MTSKPIPIRRLAEVPRLEGDHLNAQRFLESFGKVVRRSPELNCWYIWNGSWWREDRLEQIADMATTIVNELRTWVAESEGTEFKRRSKHYTDSAKAGRRDALLKIVGSDRNVVVAVEQLDAKPLLLACRNGTVDLATGELLEADPNFLLTRGVNINFDPNATSSEWEAFLDAIFGHDQELIAFVQRLLGYCCTGAVTDHILPVWHGAGANGKSTLIGVVQRVLGGHAIAAPEGLVTLHSHQPHPERIAGLRGKRLVVSNELEANAPLAEQMVKMLTGADILSGRELYGRRFNFTPSHKVLLVSNHKPRIRGNDHAIWRRVILVPFDTIIPADRQDSDLGNRLVGEHGAAVLTWLVRGAVEWNRHGLGSASAVKTATAAYRDSEDSFAEFLAERTIRVERLKTKVGDVYEVWKRWCEKTGERPGRTSTLRTALEEHGFQIETYKNAKLVVGLEIAVTDDTSPEHEPTLESEGS